MTRSVQNPTPLPSQEGDRASPSEHAIAPDIQGIDSFRPPTPFILSPASWWLESEAIVTEAVSADIAQSPTPSYTLLNVRQIPPLPYTLADTFVIGPRYTSTLPLPHAGNRRDP